MLRDRINKIQPIFLYSTRYGLEIEEKKKEPVRLPSPPTLVSTHPAVTPSKHAETQVEIISTRPEGPAKSLHSWAARISIINQVGDQSVALVKSSDETVYYRNDPMK